MASETTYQDRRDDLINEATEKFLEQMKAINVPMEEVKEIISKKYI